MIALSLFIVLTSPHPRYIMNMLFEFRDVPVGIYEGGGAMVPPPPGEIIFCSTRQGGGGEEIFLHPAIKADQ